MHQTENQGLTSNILLLMVLDRLDRHNPEAMCLYLDRQEPSLIRDGPLMDYNFSGISHGCSFLFGFGKLEAGSSLSLLKFFPTLSRMCVRTHCPSWGTIAIEVGLACKNVGVDNLFKVASN